MNISKLIAALAASLIIISGCGSPAATVPPAETSVETTLSDTAGETTPTEETTTTPTEETTTAATEESKGDKRVRTAEELAGKKVIALTFDDGPNTGVTADILDILEEYGIKASFFVIGQNINEQSAVVMKRAYSLGCEINSHSYTHSYMDKMSAEDIKDEMQKTSDLIYETVGEYPHFFRPPYIAVNQTMYDSIDLPFISGIGCDDWNSAVSVERRVKFLTKMCKENSVILLHDADGNDKTVEALRQAIPVMLEDGFEFVTVSELFVAAGITPVSDGVTYSYATETGWA